jgi:hypothetical protein
MTQGDEQVFQVAFSSAHARAFANAVQAGQSSTSESSVVGLYMIYYQ